MKLTKLTETLLLQLKLKGMYESIGARIKQAQDENLGFEDFLNIILHDEAEHKKNQKITRLIRAACFKQSASLEGFDLHVPRGIEKKAIADLATCRFISDAQNLIIMGPTGVGKTHLATALGNAACRHGYATLFYRMNSLIEQLSLARAKGTYLHFVKKLSLCDLLILDDFGIKPLTPQQHQDIYDIFDERGEHKSTVITSQLPVTNWNEVITDPLTCEAVTDRLASRALKIQLHGGTCRGKKMQNFEKNLTTIDPS